MFVFPRLMAQFRAGMMTDQTKKPEARTLSPGHNSLFGTKQHIVNIFSR